MNEQKVRQLMAAIGKVGDGYDYEEVLSACGNVMLNVLRQQHPKHIDAEEQLEALFDSMRRGLRDTHYDDAGRRKDTRIIIPPLAKLVN